ncbi:MAG: uroporphyrinogen decarboxylase family protein [Planctomycetota bacterium]
MSSPTILDDLRKCSNCQTPNRVPLLPLGLEFNMRFAGMTYRQNRLDLEKIVQMNCQSVQKFGYDWALIFPDDYVEWEPFGLEMTDEEDIPAMPRRYFSFTPETIKKLAFPDFAQGRMPIHLEAIRQVRKKLDGSACLAGRVAAPFSSVGLLFGIEPLLFAIIDKPQLVKDAMGILVDYIIRWGKAQQDAGAEILWIGDCFSSSQFLSLAMFEEFSVPYTKTVALELKRSGLFIIYHTSENSIPHIKLQADLPVDTVNLGEKVEIKKIKELINHKKCLMGNLNPVEVLRDATPDEVYDRTLSMIECNKDAGAYIFSTSEGITQNSTTENVTAMMKAARQASVYY